MPLFTDFFDFSHDFFHTYFRYVGELCRENPPFFSRSCRFQPLGHADFLLGGELEERLK